MSSKQAPPTTVEFARLAAEWAQQVLEQEQAAEKRRESADVVDRLIEAGQARRRWIPVEENLPALMEEARSDGQPVSSIAALLGVTESYVYRKLRKPSTGE